MDKKLSHQLLDLGFFSALGTSESGGGSEIPEYVKCQRPFTWDSNNGVIVVYDEKGRPWIMRCKEMFDTAVETAFDELKSEHGLTRGAGVPHSNDGGHFVCKVLPTLMSK